MAQDPYRNLRAGLLTVVALLVLASATFIVGKRQQIFIRHVQYSTTFRNVQGLKPGAPVHLEGVVVGYADDIDLSVDPRHRRVVVTLYVDARFAPRLRSDSMARIKTIGLLGDKYLELTAGSPDEPQLDEFATIPGKDPAELDAFLAGGEDVIANVQAISSSLRVILDRVEKGEGLIGEMTTAPETQRRLTDRAGDTIDEAYELLAKLNRGEGVIGRLISDESLAQALLADLGDSLANAERATAALADDLEHGQGIYATLMRSESSGGDLDSLLANLAEASAAVAAATDELNHGEGTLPRLLNDEAFASELLDDLSSMVKDLSAILDRIEQGEGNLGAFVNDEQLYRDLESVVRGVNESKVVGWFVRNRRAKGEKIQAKKEGQSTP